MSTSYREKLRGILNSGMYEECNSLSICCINDFYDLRSGIKYQVHCEDSRYKFSRFYANCNDAISKFLDIKHKLSRRKGS